MRRRRAPASAEAVLPATATPPQSQAVIDDVFLLYNDGILIKHETRRLKPDVDTDILSGMLTAALAAVEEVDATQAIVQLQTQQTAYQAALYSTAKVGQVSLLDYLR